MSVEFQDFNKNQVNTEFLTALTGIDTTLTIEENVRGLLRSPSMQEFVEEPSSRELGMLTNQALATLNNVNPVTNLNMTNIFTKKTLYELLVKQVMVEFVKMIITDYTHTGVPDSSIEDIPVQDRQPRYEALLATLNEDKLYESISRQKKALGIGTDVEAGKAMGRIRCNPNINDFDGISRY